MAPSGDLDFHKHVHWNPTPHSIIIIIIKINLCLIHLLRKKLNLISVLASPSSHTLYPITLANLTVLLSLPSSAPICTLNSMRVHVCSIVSDSTTSGTVACQAPLSMEFSRQEYWSGFPLPSLGSLQPRDQTRVSCVSCIGWQILYHFATWETLMDSETNIGLAKKVHSGFAVTSYRETQMNFFGQSNTMWLPSVWGFS